MSPVSSPMSTPQPNEGEKQGATVHVQMASTLLEQSLAAFGSTTDEGQAILSALKILGKKFSSTRDKGRDLIPSELMNLMSTMPKSAQGGQQGAPQQQPQQPPPMH